MLAVRPRQRPNEVGRLLAVSCQVVLTGGFSAAAVLRDANPMAGARRLSVVKLVQSDDVGEFGAAVRDPRPRGRVPCQLARRVLPGHPVALAILLPAGPAGYQPV